MPVRPLTPADADAYVLLRKEALLDSPWAFTASPGADRGSDPVQVRAMLSRPPHLPAQAILAVVESAKVLASAGVNRQEPAKRAHVAYIWGVYVTPSARAKGLGRAVVAAAIATARSWPGIANIQLAVSENAPAARRLYESLGFKAWGFEPDCLRIDGRSYAESHMYLPL